MNKKVVTNIVRVEMLNLLSGNYILVADLSQQQDSDWIKKTCAEEE